MADEDLIPLMARAAMGALPHDCRSSILAYFGGFTHAEITEMLDVPAGTVKGGMRLALENRRHGLARGKVSL